MTYLGLAVVALLVLSVVGYFAWRLKNGGETEAGGSMGRQMFGHGRDDWGPKS